MGKAGKKIVKYRVAILILGILLLIPSALGYLKTRVNYDILYYLPDNIDTMEGQDILMENFGKGAFAMEVVEGMTTREVSEVKEKIEQVEGVRPPMGVLDITFYRDDLSFLQEHPVVNATDLPFQVQDAKIVMVVDVLYSGRTARAAMDAICDMGRPALIQLAVMIDRGHRELPIRADYVGKNLPTSKNELVGVHVPEYDGDMSVVLYEKKNA